MPHASPAPPIRAVAPGFFTALHARPASTSQPAPPNVHAAPMVATAGVHVPGVPALTPTQVRPDAQGWPAWHAAPTVAKVAQVDVAGAHASDGPQVVRFAHESPGFA